jgi:hypothetical protein
MVPDATSAACGIVQIRVGIVSGGVMGINPHGRTGDPLNRSKTTTNEGVTTTNEGVTC